MTKKTETLITLLKVGDSRLTADTVPFPVKKGQFIFFVEVGDAAEGALGWGWKKSDATTEEEATQKSKELSSEVDGWCTWYTPYKVVFVK